MRLFKDIYTLKQRTHIKDAVLHDNVSCNRIGYEKRHFFTRIT